MTDTSDNKLPDQPQPATKKPNNRRTIILILIIAFFACGACGFIVTLFTDTNPERAEVVIVDVESATQLPTELPVIASATPLSTRLPVSPTPDIPSAEPPTPTATPLAPTATPSENLLPTIAPSPEGGWLFRDLTSQETAIRDILDRALGESNRVPGSKLNLFQPGPEERSIVIGWLADTYDSNVLIRDGLERDTITVLQVIRASRIEYDWVHIASQYPMWIDLLEANEELEILTVSFDGHDITTIVWDDLAPDQIFEMAESFYIHPGFEE